MFTIYYAVLFILSFFLTVIYVFQWHKHFDVNLTAIFILIPVANLSFCFMYGATDAEAAVSGLKTIYLGGCFLPWLTTMCAAGLCGINVSRPVRVGSFILTAAMYFGVLSIGHNTLFYRTYEWVKIDGSWTLIKQYGPLHGVFYVLLGLYMVADLAIIVYTYFRKKQASRRLLVLLLIPALTTIIGYYLNHLLNRAGFETVPLTYLLAQMVYLFIARRITLHDVSDMVIESMVQSGDTGFVSIDFKDHYLGSNSTARSILPQLSEVAVDASILHYEGLRDNIVSWIDRFRENNDESRTLYPCGDRIYSITLGYMYDGRKRRGYQIFLQDDTVDQKYIRLLDKYNSELQQDVAAKTESIVRMHDNLIMGMATMVESRDNSTGGHIRRTSEGVRILIDEMRKDKKLKLSDEFCKDIIKAAPMHDLGKIAVDDAILRKPGRYTPEEFDKMKAHAPEGARIVHEILKNTDDLTFHLIAENVAHYHHERVDGSGYPDGLKGDEIPLEARIMAIADVYDALVSKRVYKEKFSFEDADKIMMDGMGKQFDKKLEKYYVAARPRLEAFYSSEAGESS